MPGTYRVNSTSCTSCPPGFIANASRLEHCHACSPGTYTDTIGTTGCTSCGAGRFGTAWATSNTCDACPVGFFSSSTKRTTCEACPSGYYNNLNGSTSCVPTPPGTAGQSKCDIGYFCEGGAAVMEPCPAGKYGNEQEMARCLECIPGQYASGVSSHNCTKCPLGYYAESAGLEECKMCEPGKYADTMGLSTCIGCPARSDTNGSRASARVADCFCERDFYMKNATGSPVCERCPSHATTAATLQGSSGGAFSEDQCVCKENFFRDAGSPYAEQCRHCPDNALCPMNTTRPVTKAGYWHIPWRGETESHARVKCAVPDACSGPENVKEAGNETWSCNRAAGYASGPMCLVCARGFVPLNRRCFACPAAAANVALLLMALTLSLSLLLFLIRLRIRAKTSDKSVHSSVKRILMTHLQIVFIVVGLNVPWPDILVQAFTRTSALISSTGPTLSVACLLDPEHYYDFFFSAMLGAICVPIFVLTPLNMLWWFVLARYHGAFHCGRQIVVRIGSKLRNTGVPGVSSHKSYPPRTAWDAFWATQVLVLYLVMPSIWTACFLAFQTWSVDGHYYFAVDAALDLDKTDLRALHNFWRLTVAMPGLLLYAVVLPGLAALALRRPGFRSLASTRYRMGLLYTGYREERWWWEFVIFGRKLLLIVVVTFASESRYQAIFALGLLLLLFHLQHSHQPYGSRTPSQRMLHEMDIASILLVLALLWTAVLFFNDFCRQAGEWVCEVFSVVILLGNVMFVLGTGCRFGNLFAKYHRGTLRRLTRTSRKVDESDFTMFPNPTHHSLTSGSRLKASEAAVSPHSNAAGLTEESGDAARRRVSRRAMVAVEMTSRIREKKAGEEEEEEKGSTENGSIGL